LPLVKRQQIEWVHCSASSITKVVISADLKQEVVDWIKHDPDLKTAKQLQQWLDEEDLEKLTASFNGFLQFGTAGLRGPIGPRPSCMNRAVVSRDCCWNCRLHEKTWIEISCHWSRCSSWFKLNSPKILLDISWRWI
jgi:hypothetical protein